MEWTADFDLKPFNTFHLPAVAKYFASFSTVGQLKEALEIFEKEAYFILGGGSNMLFTKDVDALVLKNNITHIDVFDKGEKEVYIKAGAGEVWNDLVSFCVNKNFGGLENLALIPGSVGASPMQNIGAYGVEVKDVFHELEAFHLKEKYMRTFSGKECRFGYRDSIFKKELKGEFAILNVTFKVKKTPSFHISYGNLKEQLEKTGQELSVKLIAETVSSIRRSKLPDPNVIGNAGSFFKNPVISFSKFEILKQQYPSIPNFKVSQKKVKIPAAWLIENCGFKGYRKGDAGCYPLQPLVLVNYGNASGTEIFNLSNEIIAAVKEKFSIQLDREVNVW